MTGAGGAEHPDAQHRALREQLGELVLGQLPAEREAALRAHLDGCADCRAELAELAPLAGDLRLVDVGRWPGPPSPPPDLGARIGAAVRAESGRREQLRRSAARRSRARAVAVPLLAAAAAALVTAVLLTAGRTPADPALPAAIGERLRVTSAAAQLTGASAVLVPHTWGVEVKVVAGGLDAGREYHGVVRTRDGRLLPAGEFLGTGASPVRCNLQSALLRDDTAGFAILDSDGRTVLDLAVPA